jgi:hypothetical protein
MLEYLARADGAEHFALSCMAVVQRLCGISKRKDAPTTISYGRSGLSSTNPRPTAVAAAAAKIKKKMNRFLPLLLGC